MPGRDKIKTSGSDFGQGFSPKKKDYVGLGKPSKKKDYVGLGKPDTKKIKQKDDKSDFSGGNKFTPKVTKSIVSKKTDGNKTKTSSPSTFGAAFKAARKKQGAGGTFTYKGKKYSTNRADDKKKTKKVVKTPSNVSQGSLTSKKTLSSMKPVSSLKSSRSGVDGPSSSVNKKKAKTGFGSKSMTTKVPKKTRQGITRTPLQAKRKRRSMMGST
tara:strand:+ start:109 stop:747 length:639 start_codon:yes stop_codon:yes gene_type:complete